MQDDSNHHIPAPRESRDDDHNPPAPSDTTADSSTGTEDGAPLTGLSPEDDAWVVRVVAEMGPLTDEEREYLALIFHKRRR